MKSLKGTKTLENLLKSFAGESQARARYEMYAKVAGKEGYKQIEALFLETADNERVHAKTFYKHIVENLGLNEPLMIEINAEYPVQLGNTLENLKAAAMGEHEEFVELYPTFAKIAKEEGFPEIAASWNAIAKVEMWHEKRFLKLAKNIEEGTVFLKDGKVYWKCRNCGYVHEGIEPPEMCPACKHPKSYFEVYAENF